MNKFLNSIVNFLRDPIVNLFVSIFLLIFVFCGLYNLGDGFEPVSFVFGGILFISMDIWDYGVVGLIKRYKENRNAKTDKS